MKVCSFYSLVLNIVDKGQQELLSETLLQHIFDLHKKLHISVSLGTSLFALKDQLGKDTVNAIFKCLYFSSNTASE